MNQDYQKLNIFWNIKYWTLFDGFPILIITQKYSVLLRTDTCSKLNQDQNPGMDANDYPHYQIKGIIAVKNQNYIVTTMWVYVFSESVVQVEPLPESAISRCTERRIKLQFRRRSKTGMNIQKYLWKLVYCV